MTQSTLIRLRVNGADAEARVEPRRTLADCLRHDLRLTGTHVGCEHGVCGACTVLVDGLAVRACLILAVQAEGADIATVESLGDPETLSVLQREFRAVHALQCGFCTPGILITAHALLAEEPDASEERIREAVSGHICRCTGYLPIIEAVARARDLLRAPPTGTAP